MLEVQTAREVRQMYNLDVAVADTFYVGEGRWLVHNQNKSNIESAEFSKALRDAIAWLEARGFKAEQFLYNRFPADERGTKVIGMSTADGKIGYRIEYDGRNGAHINIFAG